MLVQVISVTFEKDVTGYGRKMGRNGGGNGIHMEDPHPYTEVEFDSRVGDGSTYFKYGTFTPGIGIRYRTENPANTESNGSGDYKPRKTGEGLPWDLQSAPFVGVEPLHIHTMVENTVLIVCLRNQSKN